MQLSTISYHFSSLFSLLGILVNNAAAATTVPPAHIVPAKSLSFINKYIVVPNPATIIRKAKTKHKIFVHCVPFKSLSANNSLLRLKSILASCSFSARAITQSTSSGLTSCNLAISSAGGNIESSTIIFCSTIALPARPIWALFCCTALVTLYVF